MKTAPAKPAGLLPEDRSEPAATVLSPRDRIFDTRHLQSNLGRRSVRGGMLTAAGQVMKTGVQMGSTAVLARLLVPADFGLVAMVAVFTGFIGLFKDLGLSMATVQRETITHRQVSTLFWINIALSLALTGLTAAVAPLIAWFYGKPELFGIMMLTGGAFVLGGASAQHVALLRRQMRYPQLAILEVVSLAFGGMIAIALALLGWGYWALAMLPVGQAFATTILSFSFTRWLPGRPAFNPETWDMIRFGGNLTGFTAVNYFARNGDNILIGRFVGAAALGIYSKAYGLLLLPLRQINGPIGAVAIPALSRLQKDDAAYRDYYLGVVRTIGYLSMPAVVLLAVLAEDIVLLLLGPSWLEAVPIFRALSASAFLQTVSATTGWVMTSRGQADRLLRWGVFQSVVAVIAFAAGLPWGALGVAIATSIQGVLLFLPTLAFAYKATPVRVADVLQTLTLPVLVSLLIFAVAIGLHVFVPFDAPLLEPAVTGLAAALAVGLTALVCRPIRRDILSFSRHFMK